MRKKKKFSKLFLIFLVPLAAVPLISFPLFGNQGAVKDGPYFISGTGAEQEELKEFFYLLDSEPEVGEEQFTMIRESLHHSPSLHRHNFSAGIYHHVLCDKCSI
jgi:hypothetical protein